MIDLIRSEWIKFRSVRSTVVTLLFGGAFVVLIAVLSITQDGGRSTTCEPVERATPAEIAADEGFCGEGFVVVEREATVNLTAIMGGVTFATLLFGVLGVQAISQEYRFNTIRPTFTAAPRRPRVLAAKLVVASSACAAVAAAMIGVCYLLGSMLAEQFLVDAIDRRAALGIVLFSALWTMAGVGVGAIVRQPIAGILILVGESLIAEQLIGGLIDGAAKWMPFTNGIQMTLRNEEPATELLAPLAGGIYFALFCVALFVIGTLLADRRDA